MGWGREGRDPHPGAVESTVGSNAAGGKKEVMELRIKT